MMDETFIVIPAAAIILRESLGISSPELKESIGCMVTNSLLESVLPIVDVKGESIQAIWDAFQNLNECMVSILSSEAGRQLTVADADGAAALPLGKP
jgi:hypothetical protein